MKKLLLLTSILSLVFSSFSFAKTYSIKKEKEGKYVQISQADIEVVLSKGKVFQQKDSNNVFVNIVEICFFGTFLSITNKHFLKLIEFTFNIVSILEIKFWPINMEYLF